MGAYQIYKACLSYQYMSKGLEFDAVLICDADSQNYHDEDDKNLLYVACTEHFTNLAYFVKMRLPAGV